MIFADLGADVIHVESSKRIDLTRIMPPYDDDHEAYIHQHLNRSKIHNVKFKITRSYRHC